jgi:hypothetical protein
MYQTSASRIIIHHQTVLTQLVLISLVCLYSPTTSASIPLQETTVHIHIQSNPQHRSPLTSHLQVSDCVAVPAQFAGTPNSLSGSLSQTTTLPSCPLIKYLYLTAWPAVNPTLTNHSGSLPVYFVALRATALVTSQFPSAGTLPTM